MNPRVQQSIIPCPLPDSRYHMLSTEGFGGFYIPFSHHGVCGLRDNKTALHYGLASLRSRTPLFVYA